jgi:hypothetical protein
VAIAPSVIAPEALVDDRQVLSLEPSGCLFTAGIVVVAGNIPLHDLTADGGQSPRGKALKGQITMFSVLTQPWSS